ncbi:MAG: AAA family ATPase, partial [Clostridia bacterium]|nr:AAA family ATPase [Clostridia bacterium]
MDSFTYRLSMLRRDSYLERLLRLVTDDKVVFVVGVRRSGKSCLAIQFEEELRERFDHVVRYNFETTADVQISAENMIDNFHKNHAKGEKYYIILDEIMRVDHWELAVNYFTENADCKLFLFSSNSRVFSDKLTAVKDDQYDVVEMLPLSLPEFISYQCFKETTPENTPLLQKQYSRFGDKSYTIHDIYSFYTTYGGL